MDVSGGIPGPRCWESAEAQREQESRTPLVLVLLEWTPPLLGSQPCGSGVFFPSGEVVASHGTPSGSSESQPFAPTCTFKGLVGGPKAPGRAPCGRAAAEVRPESVKGLAAQKSQEGLART